MRHFSRRYRCIAFNSRNYLPSDVPRSWAQSLAGHIEVHDEDEAVLNAGVLIKRACCAVARLTVVPATGHVVTLEVPGLL